MKTPFIRAKALAPSPMRKNIPAFAALLAVMILGSACVHQQTHNTLAGAASNGDVEDMKALLAAGAKVNENVDDSGSQPLYYAAWHGETKAVKVLLAAGAKVEATNKSGMQAIHAAAQGGNAETVKVLLAAGAKVDAVGKNKRLQPIHWAAMGGNTEVVKVLLDAGAKIDAIDENEYQPIHWATINNHLDTVKFLLATGAKASAKAAGDTSMDIAGKNNYKELAAFLKEQEAKEKEALQAATQKHKSLFKASFEGDAQGVKALLAAGSPMDAVNAKGFQAIHLATVNGHADIVKMLLAAGAKVDAVAKNGDQPIHIAAIYGHTEIIKLLLASGAKVNAVNATIGYQPIHWAAKMGGLDTAKCLIAAGAKVAVKTKDGKLPSELAGPGIDNLGIADGKLIAFLKEQEEAEASIDRLAASLSGHGGWWTNGMFQPINLPPNASAQEVVSNGYSGKLHQRVFGLQKITAVRKVAIDRSDYPAVFVETNRGKKIILLEYWENWLFHSGKSGTCPAGIHRDWWEQGGYDPHWVIGGYWWSRVYDVPKAKEIPAEK